MLYLLLFTISANLDNFIFAAFYTKLRYQITQRSILILSFITTVVTLISVWLGNLFHSFLPEILSTIISSSLLFYISFYLLYTSFKSKANTTFAYKGELNFLNLLILGTILSLNNLGVGIGISKYSINFLLLFLLNFSFSYLFLYLGMVLSNKWLLSKAQHQITIIGAILIFVLAITTLVI